MNLDMPYFSLLLLVAILLKHNVDEKKYAKYWRQNSRKTRSKLPIKIFLRPILPKKMTTQKFRPPQKNWRRQKILTHVKKIDPRNPRKNNDPRKNLTHATHVPT